MRLTGVSRRVKRSELFGVVFIADQDLFLYLLFEAEITCEQFQVCLRSLSTFFSAPEFLAERNDLRVQDWKRAKDHYDLFVEFA